MSTDRATRASERVPIVVANALAARQWEAYLARERLASGASAWLSPEVVGYRAWTEQLWAGADASLPKPLSPLQSSALWRRIVSESATAHSLIDEQGAAEWAADAWRLLRNWRLDAEALEADAVPPDLRAFLGWCRAYRSELAAQGWIDHATLDAELPARPATGAPQRLVLADLDEPTPAATALLSRLARAGCEIETWSAPRVEARPRRARLPDRAAELRAAAAWCGRALDRDPAARIALIVPGLGPQSEEVSRVLADTRRSRDGAYPIWHSGASLGASGLIGAALTGIELLCPGASFATLGRWLRSPLFGSSSPSVQGARAMIETRLRGQVRAQLGFQSAYRRAGLAAWLRGEAPEVEAALTAALDAVGEAQPATPGRWARRWQRALSRLGWPPASAALDDPLLKGWAAAVEDFATLTPILGALPAEAAFAELERIVGRHSAAPPLPTHGLHVFASLDAVGPGYDAAWVTGFTDTAWPGPSRLNPLLPRALQRRHGMPGASPEDVRGRATRSLERLRARVPELIFSWPQRILDYETEPSPDLTHVEDLPGEQIDALREDHPRRRGRETVADRAPALGTTRLQGGTGMLRMQARCPLRAFCQYRLGARPLASVGRGLPERWRGIATHRALQLWLGSLPSQAALVGDPTGIARAVETALDEAFGEARAELRAVFELERTRLTDRLASLLQCESRRGEFTVAAVEQERDLTLEGWTVRSRVDRVDRLSDGRVAIIDYKTGEGGGSGEWLAARLRDAQVPLYAVTAETPVAAAVIAKLGGRTVSYTGFWDEGQFPGQPRALPEGRSWPEQLALWRRQIAVLIEEFAAGDVRLFPADLDEARAGYAPLSRVAEQLKLSHGLLPPW